MRSPVQWRGRLLALVGIIGVSLSLRSAVTALAPLTSFVTEEIPVGFTELGLIGSLPLISFSLASAGVPLLLRFLTLERAMFASVVILSAGQAMRVIAQDYSQVFAGSLLTFVGIGVANVLLPPLVKRYFPDRIGLVTALYSSLMAISLTTPALTSLPVADALGWRSSLAVWAILGAIAVLPWVVLARPQSAASTTPPGTTETMLAPRELLRLFRSRTALLLAGLLAATSLNAFVVFTWLPEILMDLAGTDEIAASTLLAVFAFLGLPLALLIPNLETRGVRADLLVGIGAALFTLGYLGLIIAPADLTLLWIVLLGLGPLIFPLCLVLASTRSRTERGAVALSSFMQTFGYLIASVWPTVIGFVHEISGSWIVCLWVLLGATVVGGGLGAFIGRASFVEDELRSTVRRRGDSPRRE